MIKWHNGRRASQLGKFVVMFSSRNYTTRWIILFGTISHGHELRTMFEFSFIPADSEGLSVSRPARDQQHSALRSRTQFPQTSINATDEAFNNITLKRTIQ